MTPVSKWNPNSIPFMYLKSQTRLKFNFTLVAFANLLYNKKNAYNTASSKDPRLNYRCKLCDMKAYSVTYSNCSAHVKAII